MIEAKKSRQVIRQEKRASQKSLKQLNGMVEGKKFFAVEGEQVKVINLNLLVLPNFRPIVMDIMQDKHTIYVFKGGRAGGKSSTVALVVVYRVMHYGNWVAIRMWQNGLRNNIMADILVAIEKLGVQDEWYIPKSSLEFTHIPSRHKIVFRGLDDERKLKGIRFVTGDVDGILFDEVNEIPEARKARNVIQSLARKHGYEEEELKGKFEEDIYGTLAMDIMEEEEEEEGVGDIIFEDYEMSDEDYENLLKATETKVIYLYNPTPYLDDWTNTYLLEPAPNKVIHHSTFLTVPVTSLSPLFITEAKRLKKNNPLAYRNEYLGEVVGNTGKIFNNLYDWKVPDRVEDMPNGVLIRGVDFGFTTDPNAYVTWIYSAKTNSIYLLNEIYEYGQRTTELGEEIQKEGYWLRDKYGITGTISITSENATPQAIDILGDYGLDVEPVNKSNLIKLGLRWLSQLDGIFADKDSQTYKEFYRYRNKMKDGKPIRNMFEGDDHAIDATRYAFSDIIRYGY